MRIHRLFVDQPLQVDSRLEVRDRQAHYLATVLRVKAGQSLSLFNGKGGSFAASVVSAAKKTVSIQVTAFDAENHMPALPMHIAVGMSKGDKMDWLVQKATELGVSSIQPLQTEFCEVRLSPERQDKKIHHWQQIAISSCEQSNRNLVPVIYPVITFDQWLIQQEASNVCLLHPEADEGFQMQEMSEANLFCFGPEGGFSSTEVQGAMHKNIPVRHLGSRILRAETAPLAVMAAVQFSDIHKG